MRCLVVVAHPDDETIWMGGTITRYPEWEWYVVSLTRGDDPDRAPRFIEAARALGARAFISDLDDSSPTLAPLSPDLSEIKSRITNAIGTMLRDALCPEALDLIFTHGSNGEYRHERHEQVHRAVREMSESGDLEGGLIFFAYDDCGGQCRPRPALDAPLTIALTSGESAYKQHIIRDIYGFQPGSFELDSAGPTEAFSSPAMVVLRYLTPDTRHPTPTKGG